MANEKRLIDANAVDYENIMCSLSQLHWLNAIIEMQPTVDAVEVVHGRWEAIKDYGNCNCFGYCSNCKTPQKAANATALIRLHRYCRWCGAKMEK